MTDRLFKRHSIVGIDSNPLIYLLEGHGPEAEMAGALLDAIASGLGKGVISALAIAEIGQVLLESATKPWSSAMPTDLVTRERQRPGP